MLLVQFFAFTPLSRRLSTSWIVWALFCKEVTPFWVVLFWPGAIVWEIWSQMSRWPSRDIQRWDSQLALEVHCLVSIWEENMV